ncbi:MAG: hypothetical protein ABFS02_09050 [Pseudomonadota bacterium]
MVIVQKLLNAVPLAKGGPLPALTPDGLCGRLTVGAIRKFQSKNTGFVDGRVDAGGRTEQTLRAIVQALGKLSQILGGGVGTPGLPGATPTGPPPSGVGTPIRLKFLSILQGLLPPAGTLSNGTAPPGAKGTGCGELPARVFGRVPVIPQSQPAAFKVRVRGVTLFLTSPTTWWEDMAKQIDQGTPPRKCWVPFGSRRPLPGDIYLLSQTTNKAMFQHVGIIVDPSGTKWTTADGGQGNGWQSGFVKRDFQHNGLMTGEFGNKAYLKGWVDLDALFAAARPAFPPGM